MKPKVAFIGTGGTISSLGAGPLDILDYGAAENRMQADAILAMFPDCATVADVIPVNFDNVVSHNIYFDIWKKLVLLCDRLVADHPDLAGIVIGHGTASMEETGVFPQPGAEGPGAGGDRGQPAPSLRPIHGCGHEPGQRHSHRGLPGGAGHGRAADAERRKSMPRAR